MSRRGVRDQGAGIVFVVTAPSGTGKSTLVRRLVESVGGLRFCVSHTTRARRPGEEDGRDYWFVEEAEFRRLRDAGEFLEWAEVHGRLYGTGRASLAGILDGGDDALLDVDVQGAAALRRARADAVLVYLLPPDFDELRRRLRERRTEEAETRRRLRNAAREIREADRFDYLVINDSLETAAGLLEAIVLAERSRRARQGGTLDRIAATFPAGDGPGERQEEGS
jgi:guanylate kinase